MVSASDILFNHGTSVAPLGLIAMKGAEELGNKPPSVPPTPDWKRDARRFWKQFL